MQNGTGKKEPKQKADFSRLEETIEALHDYAGGDQDEISLPPQTAELAATYLEWLAEMLDNRRMYHKKRNLKQREAEKLLRQMLSKDELAELDRQVEAKMGVVNNPGEDTE